MNQRVGDRRLLKLAEFLKTVPPTRFDYAQWVGSDWEGAPDLSCGTTACALGWATTMPEFRRLGLRLVKSGHSGNGFVALSGSRQLFGVFSSLEAAERVFGLSFAEASFIFFPSTERDGKSAPPTTATPKQVARHIERFVKSRSA